jgi:DNA end-binding protein Ku
VKAEAAAKKSPAAKAPKPKKAKPRVEGQREMLLPIPGKKGEDKKPASVSTPRRKAG